MPTLIIRDQLVCPPSWTTSVRDITLYMTVFCGANCLIASEDPDPYYKWLKRRGAMDFIKDFVRPGSETGVWIDMSRVFPKTVTTDRITPENYQWLIFKSRVLIGM